MWQSECKVNNFKRNGGDTQNVTLSVGKVTIAHRYMDAVSVHSPPLIPIDIIKSEHLPQFKVCTFV